MIGMQAQCQRCGNRIWSEQSLRTGYGKGCRARVRLAERLAARTDDFKAEQVAKAVELIEDNAIVPSDEPRVFWCVSSDGTERYVTTLEWCSCKASVTCYHQVASAILTAA